MSRVVDYDVIVIGTGAAGLSAAALAAEGGANVLMVEAADRTGGSSALSGGVFYAAGTSLQREAGIAGDTAQAMFHYYMTLNQYKLEPALVRTFCERAAEAFEWLRGMGVGFTVENLYASGVDKVRRGHRATDGGAGIVAGLEGFLSDKNVDTVLGTRVERLLVEEGRVHGIVADGEPVRSAATVIATGGFGANPELLARLYPDAARHGDLHWYIGAPTCRGDGLGLAAQVEGQLSQINRGLLLITPGFVKDLESYLPGWLMMVNRAGRRFIDETIEYSVLAAVLDEQPGHDCFAIFDEASRLASRTTKYRPAPNWTADRLLDHVEAGTLVSAPTLDELAGKIGVPAARLATTAERYNALVQAGEDRDYFKPSAMLRPVSQGPFYAAHIRPAVICWTGTGIRIDTEARVLGADDRPVPGLYAAGETTGGMFGQCYAAGGASIGNAVVFGRIAGANAAKER
ncbi:FAD-dependent oxidoreductase [Novosphingobium panipatense]|uniref:Fumarate reductase flavoprotein subunit n=1 Tax=Novosphingobium panipatense TaxID=428991 RepID=A0ABY1QI14_9SPHN|nr:FAD-dependent oxidoreductase [Novosphingobium panipatense]SMP72100.1 fumarate reductase flavoprotein subunit [Novosphingobium panipatense]